MKEDVSKIRNILKLHLWIWILLHILTLNGKTKDKVKYHSGKLIYPRISSGKD